MNEKESLTNAGLPNRPNSPIEQKGEISLLPIERITIFNPPCSLCERIAFFILHLIGQLKCTGQRIDSALYHALEIFPEPAVLYTF